ncbi:MAG TPA: ribonuclease P protein component [Spirochaetia bacterium]|nr:ribonuclease P protein component [Spirochaetia bacterium]
MALPKSLRLSLRQQRDRLTKTGKTVIGQYFTVVSAATPDDQKAASPRLAILLSKKTANLAVDRNKIKRITSTLLESFLSSITPQDYLVIPKRQVLTESSKKLEEDLKNLFSK